jgi:hypothetical protein
MQANGLSPMVDPAPAAFLALNGVVTGTFLVLAFVPPRPYLDFVRRRAQPQS